MLEYESLLADFSQKYMCWSISEYYLLFINEDHTNKSSTHNHQQDITLYLDNSIPTSLNWQIHNVYEEADNIMEESVCPVMNLEAFMKP